MIRRAARLALLASPTGASLLVIGWMVAANPVASMMVEASAQDVIRSLEGAMRETVTRDWMDAELARALARKDLDRVEAVTTSALRQGIAPKPEQEAAIAALTKERNGFPVRMRDCAICMADIAACPSLELVAMCTIPFEMTPAGDLNALRRAAVDLASGEEVDSLEVSLAIVGLGATSLVVATGGTSLTIKTGATVLRVGRRLGSLSPAFLARLRSLAEVPVNAAAIPGYLLGARTLDEVTDTARLAALAAVSSDLGRVAANTSLSDTVVLLRHVDTTEDAARLGRLTDVTGPETRRIVDVIGPGPALRATLRLSDEVIGAALALWLAAGQMLLSIGSLLSRPLLRRIVGP